MKYARVPCAVWHDPTFRKLTANARYLFLHFFTLPEGNALGLFTFDLKRFAEQLGVSETVYEAAFTNGLSAEMWAYDGTLVWLPARFESDPPANEKVFRHCIESLLPSLPPTALREIVRVVLKTHCFDRGWHWRREWGGRDYTGKQLRDATPEAFNPTGQLFGPLKVVK